MIHSVICNGLHLPLDFHIVIKVVKLFSVDTP